MQNIKFFKNQVLLILILLAIISCSKKTSLNNKTTNDDSVKNNDSINILKENKIEFAFNFDRALLLSEVIDKANSEKKLVFVDINAKWCAPCKLMQRDVYTHDNTGKYFNDHFINYMVDIDTAEGPDLKLIFDIHVIPTLLWLDSKGRVIHKKEGACYHKELIENAKLAIDKSLRK